MKAAVKALGILALALLLLGFGPSNLRQGRTYLERGQYARALEKLTDAVNEDPDNPGIHRDLGQAYYETGQYEQALEELNKAKSKLDKDGKLIFYLGMTYERLEQYDKAVAAYSDYVKLGRFSKIKKKIRRRIQWLIRQQTQKWAKERMKMEKTIDPASIPPNTIAVTYFKPFSISKELEPLHKGLTELLIIDLSMVKSLKVLERIKLAEIYDELGFSSTDVVDQSTAPRMGKLLGARTLVTGTFTGLGGERWRIDPSLGRIEQDRLEALKGVEGKIPAFLQTEKDLVLEVLTSLGIKVTQDEREEILQNIPTESLEAFLAYSRGLDQMDKGQFDDAAAAFEEAISIDPGFDLAKESLVDSKLLMQPPDGIGDLEFAWDSALAAEKGKEELLTATVDSISPNDLRQMPVSEATPAASKSEVELEILIRW